MAREDKGNGQKVKKPLFKKWWFWVIVVCIIGAAGSGVSGGDKANEPSASQTETQTPAPSEIQEPETTPEVSPADSETTPEPGGESQEPVETSVSEPVESVPEISEADKEAAIALDDEVYSICIKAEQDYTDFIALVSTEGTSNLDAYNAAKTLKENLTDYNYRQLSKITGSDLDEFDEYKQNASLYIFVMSEVADAAMKYLDDAKTSNLSAYQEAAENVSNYSLPLVASRMTFLSASGLSDDEVYSAMGVSDSE